MEVFDEHELRSFFSVYQVCAPGDELVERTKRLMREELAFRPQAAADRNHWFIAVIGLTVFLTVNLFYMLTVGSILRLALPSVFATFLSHSLVAFSVAELSIIAGSVILFLFKQFQVSVTHAGKGGMTPEIIQ